MIHMINSIAYYKLYIVHKQNLERNPTITYRRNSLDSKILETSPSKTTNRRMSVRFDLNGEVLFAGRIEATNFESNPTFIESSRSSAGFHEPDRLVKVWQTFRLRKRRK